MATEQQAENRATTASIDRRVERLEASVAEQSSQLSLVSQEQHHLRELMTMQFSGLEAQIKLQGTKLDNFMARMDAAIAQSSTSAADLTSTPAGRLVDERLDALEKTVTSNARFISGFGGIMPLVSVVGSLVAVAKAFGWF